MSYWFIFLSTLLYIGAAGSFFGEGKYALCVVYVGYALANVGFLVLAS